MELRLSKGSTEERKRGRERRTLSSGTIRLTTPIRTNIEKGAGARKKTRETEGGDRNPPEKSHVANGS